MSSATPIVATSTITRGAFDSRRMTNISTTAPAIVRRTDREHERDPVREVRTHDHDREERGRGNADVGDREVDDARRPVDEHDAHRRASTR